MELSSLISQLEKKALQQVLQKEDFLRKNFLQESLLQNFKQGFHKGFIQGFEQGFEQGVRTERRTIIENLLRVRFGNLDEELSGIIEPLLELPPEEFAVLLLQLSREELLARFGG